MAFESLKKMFGNGNGSGSELLLPADQFRTLILHECARCNRNAHAFSLIHIDLRGNGRERSRDRSETVRRLSRSLVRRMRTTDEIGWLDGHSVGVFLPETAADGAGRLAADACQGFSYQIYTYPWLSSFGDDGRNSRGTRRGDNGGEGAQHRSYGGADREEQLTLHSEDPGSESVYPATNTRGDLEELIMPPGPPAWKRAYDIFGSTILLIALSPVFAVVALYIKIVSPGPVFFRQERVGYLGHPFILIKFRTMKTGSDNVSVHKDYLKGLIGSDDKAMTKLDTARDDRLIPLAGLLRRTCIDELPQLINVFKGDMSLVGPRPCLDYEAEEFALWQRMRFHTVPGMTGLWQVSGKNRLTFKEMMRLDIRYASRKSAAMDLAISLKTVPAILGQVRDAVKAKRSSAPVVMKNKRAARKWSLNDLVRQFFL